MNLRQLRTKIKSIQNVGQITKAMQLVSAVKMKKAQTKASVAKPYRTSLEETISKIANAKGNEENRLMQSAKIPSRTLAIIVASNKGLCGVFNFNLFKFMIKEIANFDRYDFIVLGTKAQQFISHFGGKIVADFSKDMPFENNVTAVYSVAREQFIAGSYSRVELFFNQFVSSLVFRPAKKTLLPLNSEAFVVTPTETRVSQEYLVEPDRNTVLEGLLNFYIESQIRGAIQESEAAEHSARMIAMKNATDNSKELVYSLTLLRNSLRQTRITNELLDMNTARLAVSS